MSTEEPAKGIAGSSVLCPWCGGETRPWRPEDGGYWCPACSALLLDPGTTDQTLPKQNVVTAATRKEAIQQEEQKAEVEEE